MIIKIILLLIGAINLPPIILIVIFLWKESRKKFEDYFNESEPAEEVKDSRKVVFIIQPFKYMKNRCRVLRIGDYE